jgi:hypothetical protein
MAEQVLELSNAAENHVDQLLPCVTCAMLSTRNYAVNASHQRREQLTIGFKIPSTRRLWLCVGD